MVQTKKVKVIITDYNVIAMKLQEGAYENIITSELQQDMKQAESDGLVCKQEDMDTSETPSMLAEHVNKLVLNKLSDDNLTAEERTDFVNKLIDFIGENKEEKVIDDKQMLSAVVSKQENAKLNATNQNLVRPLTELDTALRIYAVAYRDYSI